MGWAVLGESVTGTSHRARDVPCQDAFRSRTFGPEGESLVLAVADGAGSATHSGIAATLTCDELVRRAEALDFGTPLTQKGILSLFSAVRDALLAEAERLAVSPREFACTVLFAVVRPGSATFAQIGDGAIVVTRAGCPHTVFWPEPAEYANATDFLTDEHFADVIRFETTADPVVEVAAFSDGLQRLALQFAERTAFAGFFTPLFGALRGVDDPETLRKPFGEFLDSGRVNERTDDDKTLVIAVRRP
jgi:hypothetical protein